MKTVIGPDTRIAGPLSGKDDLVVQGTVDGPVHGEAQVTIAAGARIGGRGARARRRSSAASSRINGVRAPAIGAAVGDGEVLTGDIEAPRIAIDEGARLRRPDADGAHHAGARKRSRRAGGGENAMPSSRAHGRAKCDGHRRPAAVGAAGAAGAGDSRVAAARNAQPLIAEDVMTRPPRARGCSSC